MTSILWRRLDSPGHDSARLTESPSGAVLEGAALFAEADRPCRFDYRIQCDSRWRTTSVRVTGWMGGTPVALAIAVDASRMWTMNGVERPAVRGCHDVDLSFTPATNLLPIRRLRLQVGARSGVRAAWLRVPELTLEPLEQTYERVSELSYSYESGGGSFTTRLEIGAAGFVTQYSGLWQMEAKG